MTTKYRQAMEPSIRTPKPGAAWITTVVSGVLAVAFAIFASTYDVGTTPANILWLVALGFGTIALLAWYAVAIHWARRRKRLWG
ncbi:MAG: hypothetical protein ACK5MR_16735 [Cumulibacter sp.]